MAYRRSGRDIITDQLSGFGSCALLSAFGSF